MTQNHTKTTTKVPTIGLCRDTSTIYEAEPLIVTVDVNITTTREFVPTVNSTLVVVSEVTAAALQQCFIKQTSLALATASTTTTETVAPSAAAASAESSGEETTTTLPTETDESAGVAQGTDDLDDEDETTSEATSSTSSPDLWGVD
ncbi:hypothetical protein BFJ72_g4655 [Fusarium proliferatum]|uniref:Uncharacterized protein n=1 Tax=Gibberella intermedia TaxID=948311 RepID=A0A420TP32_GIBIN|nr:hypothetical protein BFJ72_g4655 [Fusarium proliferatum]